MHRCQKSGLQHSFMEDTINSTLCSQINPILHFPYNLHSSKLPLILLKPTTSSFSSVILENCPYSYEAIYYSLDLEKYVVAGCGCAYL